MAKNPRESTLLNSNPSKKTGFTLIEVMVSLAIFSLCAAVLSAQSTSTIHNRQRIIDQQIALWVAKNTLAHERINNTRSTSVDTEFREQTEQTQAGILWTVNKIIAPTSDPQLKKITVTVNRHAENGSPQNQSAQLVSFVKSQ